MSRPVSLCLLLALLIALRVSAPSDLMEGAQSKQVGYVMDVLLQRHWLLQYEINGEVATKPPLYNWCAAAICQVCGTEAEWAMKLPSLLAGVGLLCCVYWLARHYFDARVAFYAVVAGITSHHFSKLAWFARTDMLMTFLLYLGIVVQLAWQPGWRRTLCISLIMAGCALTKGPTGPLLYLLFLGWWCWENQAWERSDAWKHFFAGSALCLGITGLWVAAVWQMPEFQEQVIYWQLGDRLVDPGRARSFTLPMVYLFTRIAPWPLLAIAGVWISKRQQISWCEVKGLVIWTVLFLAFFCVIPTKRHDHVLPVYPPVYLLAGFALKQILEPVLLPRARWVMWPLCGFLMACPFVLPWVNQPEVWGLMGGAFVCGAVGFLVYLHGRRFAFVVAATGLLCLHGLYHHQIHGEGRVDYDKLLAFVKDVKTKRNSTERLAVFQAHPLIAYELRMHETLIQPAEVAALQPTWVITTEEQKPKLQEAMQAELILVDRVSLAPRRDRAQLYRVARTPEEKQWAQKETDQTVR